MPLKSFHFVPVSPDLLKDFLLIYINLIWKGIDILNAMRNNPLTKCILQQDGMYGDTLISLVFCNFLIIFALFHFLLYRTDRSEAEQTFLECSRSRDNTGESGAGDLTVRRLLWL